MLGLVGLQPSAGAYCASKGAVVLLTKQVAVEYAKDKIHCNALCPGCKTPFPLTRGGSRDRGKSDTMDERGLRLPANGC